MSDMPGNKLVEYELTASDASTMHLDRCIPIPWYGRMTILATGKAQFLQCIWFS